MIPWLILVGLIWFGVHSFRKALPESIDTGHDVVAEAERLTGYRSHPRRWIRPVVATTIAWASLMATLTPIDPTLAVWVGGAVVMLGSLATGLSIGDPLKLDDATFDAELRNLLDQYS
jgi:hypothetical protein